MGDQHLSDRLLLQQPGRSASGQRGCAEFRPYPHLGSITMRSNFGHSTFHSGTIKLEKRMSKGLYFNTFYTFSKAINSADTDNLYHGNWR